VSSHFGEELPPPPPPPDETETVRGQSIDCVPFRAVRTYVVSDDGSTVVLPERAVALITLIETESMLLVLQLRTVLSPRRIEEFEAVNETLFGQLRVGGGVVPSVTGAAQVT
jgi:hypothetical protein